MTEAVEWIKAILLGIVQGITEWLPISSTGHMILVDEFIKLNVTPEFKEMFFVVIQLGSILAVVLLYFHKLNPFAPSKTKKQQRATIDLWIKVLIAVVPAGVIGILFDDIIDAIFYNSIVVSLTLILYGVFFIVLEQYNKYKQPTINNFHQLNYQTAMLIGGFQILALIPGTSRSGATILGAMILGMSRVAAAEFSFYLAIPVMFGASFIKLIKFGFVFTVPELTILFVGSFVAFVVSVFAIRFLMAYIKKHDFTVFGYYRIVLGVLVLGYFLFQ